MRGTLMGMCLACAMVAHSQSVTTWMPLFNGVDLAGWRFSDQFWRTEAGAIHGEGKATGNTYCFLPARYSDFVLVAKTRLWQSEAGYTNSGIQYRSAFIDSSAFRMKGYQWDMGDGWDGSLYPEGHYPEGLQAIRETEECQRANLRNDWNQVVISADGDKVIHELNGKRCVEYKAEVKDGFIGLQLNATRIVMKVEFKDIFIRPLNGSFAIPESAAVRLGPDFAPESASIRGGKGGALPMESSRVFDALGRIIGGNRSKTMPIAAQSRRLP